MSGAMRTLRIAALLALLAPSALAAPAPMLGEMVYLADAARFIACRGGQSLPIAMEAGFPALQALYAAGRPAPGAPLVVILEAEVAARPRMEGSGTQPSLVVTRPIGAFPGLTCDRARADSPLEETLWRIVSLGGEAVAPSGGRAATLQMRVLDGQRRLAASAGCNRIAGTYALEPDGRLALSPGAMTRMACQAPLDALERRLVETLTAARSWRVLGPTLELRDAGGATLATFEALHL